MKFDWKYLRSDTIIGFLSSIGVAAFISLTSTIHFLIAVSVLLFNWLITPIIIEYIASRNPDANQRVTVRSWWPPVITLVVILTITVITHFAAGVRFWTVFGYCTLISTFVGAINGIVAEVEDNAPGGWLNPKQDKNGSD